MQYLNKYLKKYGLTILFTIFILGIEIFFELYQPKLMAKIINVGVKNKDLAIVTQLGSWMIVLTILGAISAITRNIISSTISQRIGNELRSDIFKKINTLSIEQLDEFDRASLITRLTNDVSQIQNFVMGIMRFLLRAPFIAIGSIIMAFTLDLQLSLILLLIVPILLFLITLNIQISYPNFNRIQKSLDHLNAIMREYLSGVRVIKAFNRYDYEINRFDEVNQQLSKITTRTNRIINMFSPMMAITVNLGIVATLYISGYKIKNEGNVIAFINYMTQILFALSMLSFVFNMYVRAKTSYIRIKEILSMEYLDQENLIKETCSINGEIEFKNVSFSYKYSSDYALNTINFSIKNGQTIGIIGSTGSGKTTLVQLIPNFYSVTSGEILINNQSIQSINTFDLRKEIAIVPQKNILFTGSIKENLMWGKRDATLEEMKEVTSISQAHEFVERMQNGYDTILGRGGVNLSGGQKQRLSIARALLKKPKILILDDCTSAVDLITERKIMNGIKNYSKDMTILLIAQRITSVMNCDQIIVLEQGVIEGTGTHNELLKTCRVYKEIYESQIGKEMNLNV